MLGVRLEAPDFVKVGTQVEVRLIVTNTGTTPIDLYLRGREPTLEVEVTRENGDVVWRRLDGEIVPAVLLVYALLPARRLEVAVQCDFLVARRPVNPGAYELSAYLLGEDSPIRAPAHRLTVLA